MKKRLVLEWGDFRASVYFVKSVPKDACPGPCRALLQTVVALDLVQAVTAAEDSVGPSWRVDAVLRTGEERSHLSHCVHSYGGFDSFSGCFTDDDIRFLVIRDFYHVPYEVVTYTGYCDHLPGMKVVRDARGTFGVVLGDNGDEDTLFRCRTPDEALDMFERELDFRKVCDPAVRHAYSGKMSEAISAFVSREFSGKHFQHSVI